MSETKASSGFDSQKSEASGARLLSMLNDGAMASIGHRTGLFDAIEIGVGNDNQGRT